MNTKEIMQELNEIECSLDKVNSFIELTANSCAYKNNFAEEDILREAMKKQNVIIEKLTNFQVKYFLRKQLLSGKN